MNIENSSFTSRSIHLGTESLSSNEEKDVNHSSISRRVKKRISSIFPKCIGFSRVPEVCQRMIEDTSVADRGIMGVNDLLPSIGNEPAKLLDLVNHKIEKIINSSGEPPKVNLFRMFSADKSGETHKKNLLKSFSGECRKSLGSNVEVVSCYSFDCQSIVDIDQYLLPESFSIDKNIKSFYDAGVQLKTDGYIVGEKNFNKIVFNINDDDIKLILDLVSKEEMVIPSGNIQSDQDGQKFLVSSVYMEDGVLTGIGNDFPLDFRKLLYKILKNLVEHISEKYIGASCVFLKDCTLNKAALSYHRDFWLKVYSSEPRYLAFSVLSLAGVDPAIEVSSKLRLGYISNNKKNDFTAEDISETCKCFSIIQGDSFSKREEARIRLEKGEIQHLISVDNATGSGYIIDQDKLVDNYKLIVHARDERNTSSASSASSASSVFRLSMIIRVMPYKNKACIRSDSYYVQYMKNAVWEISEENKQILNKSFV